MTARLNRQRSLEAQPPVTVLRMPSLEHATTQLMVYCIVFLADYEPGR